MKNKRALEIDRRANIPASSEKSNFTGHLVDFWRDLEDNQRWKYDQLSPVQLLENLIDHEMAPGNTVDNGKALRTNIVSSSEQLWRLKCWRTAFIIILRSDSTSSMSTRRGITLFGLICGSGQTMPYLPKRLESAPW